MRKPDKSEKRIKELEAQVEGLKTMNRLLRQTLRNKGIAIPRQLEEQTPAPERPEE